MSALALALALARTALLVTGLAVAATAAAATLRVGPAGPFKRVADAAAVARDGDVVEIEAGTYTGDVALWTQKSLTLRGVGGRPVLTADGRSAEGKAIWVIRNGDFVVENIEFRGARVPDGNGAGIRFEDGRLQVRNCHFFDNQNGILTGNQPGARLQIVDSVFARAPRQDGPLPHVLYVGRIAHLAVRGSRFHDGYRGHLIKSRARVADLRYNLVVDGESGEASYEMDFPEGGDVTLVGNVIAQSARTHNPVVIAFGAEGGVPGSRLRMAHNTLVSQAAGAWFLRVWDERFATPPRIVAQHTLTDGVGVFALGARGQFSGNWPALGALDTATATLDFGLPADHWLRGRVVRAAPGTDADLVPDAEFRLPLGTRPLDHAAAAVPGAIQSPQAR